MSGAWVGADEMALEQAPRTSYRLKALHGSASGSGSCSCIYLTWLHISNQYCCDKRLALLRQGVKLSSELHLEGRCWFEDDSPGSRFTA